MIVGQLILRRVIGVLGILFPALVIGWSYLHGTGEILPSLSAYYGNDGARDMYVGVQFATAWFFFAYQGHDRRDVIVSKIVWLSTLLVALVPSTTDNPIEGQVHFVAASIEFAALAYFSLFLFTETTAGASPTPEKLKRNRLYRVCGWAMVVILALAFSYYVLLAGKGTWLDAYNPILVLESAALLAFGLSWLVKGETLWRDR